MSGARVIRHFSVTHQPTLAMTSASSQAVRSLATSVLKFMCVAAAGATPPAAYGACKSNTSDGLSYYTATIDGFTPTSPLNPTTAKVGDVLYKETGTPRYKNKGGAWATYSCNPGVYAARQGIGAPDPDYIYPTSVAGIGIRISELNNNRYPFTPLTISSSGQWGEKVKIIVELIKTGTVSAGGTLEGAFARWTANPNGATLVEFRFSSPVTVQPGIPTCKVGTPNVSVSMGSMSATVFSGKGSTSKKVPFHIQLNCSGGDDGSATNVYMTLTDSTNLANTSTTLSLDKNSTSSGLGVEILKDDTVLGYGPDSAAPGNTNQWKAGAISKGTSTFDIPLTARYIQTGAKVTGGSANARATFTMSYQ